jgi:chromosome segregation ATPase
MFETLNKQKEDSEIALMEMLGIIDSLSTLMHRKEELIRSLKIQLREQQIMSVDYSKDVNLNDELKQTKEALEETQEKVNKLYRDNKKARRKIRKLETHMDQQLSEWASLEKKMVDARISVDYLESGLGRDHSVEDQEPLKEYSINECLDLLSQKVTNART